MSFAWADYLAVAKELVKQSDTGIFRWQTPR
jgi:hypothetical protein